MSPKMKEVLKILATYPLAGLTLDELRERHSSTASRQAMLCTLEFLDRRGVLSRSYVQRDGKIKLHLKLTAEGIRAASFIA